VAAPAPSVGIIARQPRTLLISLVAALVAILGLLAFVLLG
jgi:hypothetical protein